MGTMIGFIGTIFTSQKRWYKKKKRHGNAASFAINAIR
jgi:hypothetical protein